MIKNHLRPDIFKRNFVEGNLDEKIFVQKVNIFKFTTELLLSFGPKDQRNEIYNIYSFMEGRMDGWIEGWIEGRMEGRMM